MEEQSATAAAATRRGYLFACGLAMVAAVLGVVAPTPEGEPVPGGRATTILVIAAAGMIFAVAALRLRREAGAGPADPRLVKMTGIWLALAALLGAAAVRAPALALWSDGPGALDAPQWLAGVAGCAVVLVAAARGAALFRR